MSKVFTSIYEVAPEMWNQKEKKKEGEELDIPIRLLTPEFVEQFDTYLRTLKKSNEDFEDANEPESSKESLNKNSDDKLLANNQVVKYVERFKYFFKYAKYEYDKECNYNFPDPFIRYKFVYEKPMVQNLQMMK